jgi:hypothetical protein
MNLTKTAGAVPKAVKGLPVVVPPLMVLFCPSPPAVADDHVVVSVNAVEPPFTAAMIEIVSEV